MTDQQPHDPFATGPVDAIDSDSTRRPGGGRRGALTAGLVVLALVLAGLVGGVLARSGGPDRVALAAGSSTATPSAGPDTKLKGWRHGPMMGGRGGPGFRGALHGTFVVPDGSGGYRTMVMQRGKATAVSSTSITVTSVDGFVQTYAVTSTTVVASDRNGIAGITKNAVVAVMGEQKQGSSDVTALHVADLAAFAGDGRGPGLGGMMRGGPGDDDGDGPTAAPTTTSGTSFGA